MDWLASEEGSKLALGVEKARMRLLRAKETTEALDASIKAGSIDGDAATVQQSYHHAREHTLRNDFQLEWLKTLCDQMYHSLSRELRDIVYAHVVDCFDFTIDLKRFPDDAVWMHWDAIDPLASIGSFDEILLYETEQPRFNPLTHLGEAVVREIAELSYRNKIFTSAPQAETQNILLPDGWGLGMKPADHIQFVNLCVYEKHFNDPGFLRNLAALAHIKHKASINVDIYPEAQGLRRPCCPATLVWGSHFLEIYGGKGEEITAYFNRLRPIVDILDDIKKAGYRVTIRMLLTRKAGPRSKEKFVCLFSHKADVDFSMEGWIEHFLEAQKELLKKKYVCQCDRPTDIENLGEGSDFGDEDDVEELEFGEDDGLEGMETEEDMMNLSGFGKDFAIGHEIDLDREFEFDFDA